MEVELWWFIVWPIVLYVAVRIGSMAYFHAKRQFLREITRPLE